MSSSEHAPETMTVVDADRLHQLEVLQHGLPGAPMVLMSAGWNARFVYAGLASLLPATIGVGVLIAYPYPGANEGPVLDAVEDRAAGFEQLLLDAGLAAIDNRPVVPLGYSRGGLVSHELAVRLTARGVDVPLEVLIDTLFPGEERERREINSLNRRSKYRTMAESRQFATMAREVKKRAGKRVRAMRTSSVSHQLVQRVAPARFGLEAAPLSQDDYSPPPVQHRGLVYRASETVSAWTTDRWREVIPVVDEVVVEGRHTPPNSIMEPGRIDHIGVDLAARLSSLVP